MQATLWPDDASSAVQEHRRAQRRGEDLLVAWSRSTSASSIYRYNIIAITTTILNNTIFFSYVY